MIFCKRAKNKSNRYSFDDIKLYTDDEGIHQKEIMNKIASYLASNFPSTNVRLAFCPTYYSFDPILDKCFGKRPSSYFQEITKILTKM